MGRKSKFLGLFDKRPLIWFHYVLLTFVLFGAFFSLKYFNIVEMSAVGLSSTQWVILFVWYYAFIALGDQIIHTILGVD